MKEVLRPIRKNSILAVLVLAASLFWAACVENPWATPTPTPPPPPLPVLEAPLVLPSLDAGARAQDSSGNRRSPILGERIAISKRPQEGLTVAIPVGLPERTVLGSLSDPVTGVVLAGKELVIPVRDGAGKVVMNLSATVGPLAGTGGRAEGKIERLELETAPLAWNVSPPDPELGEASFQFKAELKSLPPGAGLKVALGKSPPPAVATAFTRAAARAQNSISHVALVAEVTKTGLVEGRDIGPTTVTMLVGRDWVDRAGLLHIAIAALADDGSAELLPAQLVRYTPEAKALLSAQSAKGASAFGLVAVASAMATPTPTPSPVFYTLKVTADGSDGGAVLVMPPRPDSRYPAGTVVALRAAVKQGYEFVRWEGDVTGSSIQVSVVMDSDKTIVARLTLISFELNAGSMPPHGGKVDISPYLGSYDYGTRVTVTAEAFPGFVFSHWSGDVATGTNPATLVLDRPKSVTANFSAVRPSFSTSVSPPGAGSVNPPRGNAEFNATVTLTAAPSPGHRFSHWSGEVSGTQNPVALLLDRNKSVVANFTRLQFALKVQAQPATWGSVSPPGGSYEYGQPVMLTAVANPDYLFAGWSGDVSGSENPITVTITRDTNVTAQFELRRYSLYADVSPPGAGFIIQTGSTHPVSPGVYTKGTVVLLSANPTGDHVFVSWSGDVNSLEPSIVVEMNRDISVFANFRYVGP